MTVQPLLMFAMLGCGLASALILFRAAAVVYQRNHQQPKPQDDI